jgi:LysR family transcriptional regulator, transcriptional activator for dmlA
MHLAIHNAHIVNSKLPNIEDLEVFVQVAQRSSFVAAAKDLGVSPAYVTKRVRMLETSLGATLFHRTTRRVVVSEDGERTYHWAQKVLDDVDHLVEEIGTKRQTPRGMIRICSSFGFGRRVVAPALSGLGAKYPGLQVRFEVFDRLVDVGAEGFDLDIRIGDEISPHHIAKRLGSNHRVLCASPAYLKKHGRPSTLAELAAHDCLIIRERDHPFGVWRLRSGNKEESVKVRGSLSSNNGEIVVRWAVDGSGIILRSVWDVGPLLKRGKLVRLLPEWTQEANVWAVYPTRLETSAKVRVCIDWLHAAINGPGVLGIDPVFELAPEKRTP